MMWRAEAGYAIHHPHDRVDPHPKTHSGIAMGRFTEVRFGYSGRAFIEQHALRYEGDPGTMR